MIFGPNFPKEETNCRANYRYTSTKSVWPQDSCQEKTHDKVAHRRHKCVYAPPRSLQKRQECTELSFWTNGCKKACVPHRSPTWETQLWVTLTFSFSCDRGVRRALRVGIGVTAQDNWWLGWVHPGNASTPLPVTWGGRHTLFDFAKRYLTEISSAFSLPDSSNKRNWYVPSLNNSPFNLGLFLWQTSIVWLNSGVRVQIHPTLMTQSLSNEIFLKSFHDSSVHFGTKSVCVCAYFVSTIYLSREHILEASYKTGKPFVWLALLWTFLSFASRFCLDLFPDRRDCTPLFLARRTCSSQRIFSRNVAFQDAITSTAAPMSLCPSEWTIQSGKRTW